MDAGPEPSDGVALTQAQANCATPLDVDQFATAVDGIEFGPAFRWIDAICSGERQTLARLRMPQSFAETAAAGYWIHPGLLDACFQAAEATLGETGEPALPFGMKCLFTQRPATGTVWWTHAVQVGEFTWDIRLFDSTGATIAAIEGFEARKASRGALQRTADWLY